MTVLPIFLAILLPLQAKDGKDAQDPKEAPALVDNDEFAAWSKLKAGSWIRYKVTDPKMESEVKATFRGIKKDAAVVDQEFIFTGEGAKQTTSVPRSIPPKLKKGETDEGHKRTVVKDGTETIAVGGKKLKCKWVEYKIEYKGGGADSWRSEKVWISPDVVGGIARLEKKEATDSKATTWEALEWKAIK